MWALTIKSLSSGHFIVCLLNKQEHKMFIVYKWTLNHHFIKVSMVGHTICKLYKTQDKYYTVTGLEGSTISSLSVSR